MCEYPSSPAARWFVTDTLLLVQKHFVQLFNIYLFMISIPLMWVPLLHCSPVQILAFLEREAVGETCPLAGSSIHFHRRFIMKYMPRLEKRLHYRIVDVSTIKELAARWYPNELKLAPSKKGAHSALNDIRGSIEELRYYRSSIFKGPHGW